MMRRKIDLFAIIAGLVAVGWIVGVAATKSEADLGPSTCTIKDPTIHVKGNGDIYTSEPSAVSCGGHPVSSLRVAGGTSLEFPATKAGVTLACHLYEYRSHLFFGFDGPGGFGRNTWFEGQDCRKDG